MESDNTFHYEVEKSQIPEAEVMDSRGKDVTTFKCHGRLVLETRHEVEDMIKTQPFHGHIFIDLGDVNYIDSAGLGALIRLKMSAIKEGGVSVTFKEITPRVMQLLKITNLADWFTS